MRRRDGFFNPDLESLTPQHSRLSSNYELLYAINDFLAGATFVIGSVLFFKHSTETAGVWLFLIGSILFTVRPGIRVIRNLHLLHIQRRQEVQLRKRHESMHAHVSVNASNSRELNQEG